MKTKLFTLIIIFLCYTGKAQNKTCQTNKDNAVLDLNTITINKCSTSNTSKKQIQTKSITQNKAILKSPETSVKQNELKQTVSNSLSFSDQKIRKINTTSEINRNSHYVRKKKTTLTEIDHSLETETLLFSLVDEVPLFPECFSTYDKSCFINQFEKYFTKNFDSEKIAGEDYQTKVFIQFTINTHGHICEINIKGRNINKNITQEIKRTLNKLPHFIPGKQKGIPVPVKFSLPLNFNTY